MLEGSGAGLGAQSLLLSGHDPDQGRQPDRALRGFCSAPRVAFAPGRSRRRARRRRRHCALAQTHRQPRARPRLRHLAARAAARHAFRRRGVRALRAREDAAGGDRILADGNVLARHHQRAHGRDAGELPVRHPRNAVLFRQASAAGPARRRFRAQLRQAKRQDARAAAGGAGCARIQMRRAVGRCWTRCLTPTCRPAMCRRAHLCRTTNERTARNPGLGRRAAAPAARRAAHAQRSAGRLDIAGAGARVQGRRDRARNSQALHRRGDA